MNSIRSDLDTSLICANFSAVKSIKDGSFFFPRLGAGAKYGLSVSIKILFICYLMSNYEKRNEILNRIFNFY